MKHIRVICATLLAAAIAAVANAQTAVNTLVFEDVKVQAGKSARLPFALDNQDDVAALQFDLALPAGIKIDGGVTLSNRARKTHTITGNQIGDKYRVVILSNKNRFISEDNESKDLVYIDVQIPDLSPDAAYKPVVSNLVISDIDGKGLNAETQIGEITIARMPDLKISSLSTTAQSIDPGDAVTLTWSVSNIGELPTTGGFSEQISIMGLDGSTRYLATTTHAGILAAGTTVSRTATVTIPEIPNVDGLCLFDVKVVPNSDAGEPTAALANNEMVTESEVFVSKYLTLSFPSEMQEAPYPGRIYSWTNPYRHTGTVTRSGSRVNRQVFKLALNHSDGNGRLVLPESVTLDEGQTSASFTYWFYDNSLLDNDSIFVLTLSGGGYDPVVRDLKLKDDETPRLFIALDKEEAAEGESFAITVTSERAPQQDIDVRLTASRASKFELPYSITIHAGQTTGTAKGKAADNNLPELDETFSIRTSATGYTSQSTSIKVLDNDIPQLGLGFNQGFITESDDSTLVAIISRTTNIDKRVTVRLSDNKNGQLRYSTQAVMEAGNESVTVPIKPIDNSTVDYSRTVTMTAQVYLDANSVNAPSTTPGYATANIEVLDDDGLTLSIRPARSTWAEGNSSAELIISRNTTTQEGAITVNLSSDQEGRFEYSSTITLAAGETSKRAYVNIVRNQVTGDDTTAVFTATATDYNPAKCTVYISDTSHPDATITSFSLSASSAEITSPFTATAVIKNVGYDILPASTEVTVYQNNSAAGTATIGKDLPVDESTSVTFALNAIQTVGTTGYHATANAGHKVTEMTYSNNTSATAYLYTSPGFAVTELSTDKKLYKPGEAVTISGHAEGNHAADAPILIYIKWGNIRHTISTSCDKEGNFTEEWQPFASMAGHITMGATHPSVSSNGELASIDIYGLRLTQGNNFKYDIEEDNNKDHDFVIYNPGPDLTSLQATVVEKPDNCDITLENANIATLASGKSATIKMHITNTKPSQKSSYDNIVVKVTTAEELEVSAQGQLHCRYHNAHLQLTPSRQDITIVKGKTRSIQVELKNTGLRETGKISVSTGKWVTNVSHAESMQPDASGTITLDVTAPDDINLVGRHIDPIYVSWACANGSGATLQLNAKVVAEEKGRLTITASDDNTYNSDDHPHLSGANVTITNSTTGAVVTTGTTGNDGTLTVPEILEGYYDVRVTCNSPELHYPFTQSRYLVNPGTDNELEAMLYIKTVSGFVVDDDKDDEDDKSEVEFVVDVKPSTNAPAITMKLPAERPSLNMVTQVEVSNAGNVPVARTDIQWLLPSGYEIEIIDKPYLDFIAPQATATFYGVLRLTEEAPDDADPANGCFQMGATTFAKYLCGQYSRVIETTARKAWGACSKEDIEQWTSEEPTTPSGTDPSPSLPSGRAFDIDGTSNYATLQLSRTTTMTGQTIQATLSISNKSDKTIGGISFDLALLDLKGDPVNDSIFAYDLQSLGGGLAGNSTLAGKWSIGKNDKGTATIDITPSAGAAERVPVLYYVGGTMHYTNPSTGEACIVKLMSIPMYVNPMPILDLTYFLQRDIYGDDLLTPNIKEPSLPAEFSLLVNNSGNGVASNVEVVTHKPRVLADENSSHTTKTLDFRFVGAQLNGAAITPNTYDDITTNFGTIANGATAYAQWWMTCNYMGHFVSYDVNTRLASQDLSEKVLGDISVHELIHSLNIDMEAKVPLKGFLANDVEDEEDRPDKLYLTTGETLDVHDAMGAKCTGTVSTGYTLTITPSQAGWNYGTISDPTRGRFKLTSVERKNDGKKIDPQNFWQTDRTMPDGSAPVYENLIHFADEFADATPQEYTLGFAYTPDQTLAVKQFTGLPEEVAQEPLQSLGVTFNKEIDPATFSIDDLALTCQGEQIETKGITIAAQEESKSEFTIGLQEHTAANGLYVLSLNTEGINDAEGYAGESLHLASWTQFSGGTLSLTASAEPADGGTVTPEQATADYGSEATLKAQAGTDYQFSHWTLGDETVSKDEELTVRLFEDAAYTAHFVPRLYKVEITSLGGKIEGAGSGTYKYGTTLEMKAVTPTGWAYDGWRINGTPGDSKKTLKCTVQDDMEIEACFTQKNVELCYNVPEGWSWITPLTDSEWQEPANFLSSAIDNVERLVDITQELVKDEEYGLTGNLTHLTPQSSYKIKMKQQDVIKTSGRISLSKEIRLYVSKGWNWMGYVPRVPMEPSTALASLNPQENDVVKSQNEFATYSGGQWKGSLTVLQPNEGYMYYSASDNTFFYPNNNAGIATSHPAAAPAATPAPWHFDAHRYPDNITLVATVEADGRALGAGTCTVGAFAGEECRGIGRWVDDRLCITVHGEAGDAGITFRIIDNVSGEVNEASETVSFGIGHAGSWNAPYVLHADNATPISGAADAASYIVCPNPVQNRLYITGPVGEVKAASVVAMSGATVIAPQHYDAGAGLDVARLTPGHYVLCIVTTQGTVYKRFLKE